MTVERAVPGEAAWAELSAPHMARYLLAAEFAQGQQVLDAGSGAGYGASILNHAGAHEVHGVDVDPQAVRLAQERFGGPHVHFLVDDCEVLLSISQRVDLICCFEAIEHLERPERFLRRAGKLLKREGTLLVSTPDRASTPPFVNGRPRNPYHVNEWSRDEFETLLSAHFSSVEMRVQVESVALHCRLEAVRALRQGLMWTNPLAAFLLRKWPTTRRAERPWKKLSGLAAATIADYPIIASRLAPAYGKTCFHFAICRQPIES